MVEHSEKKIANYSPEDWMKIIDSFHFIEKKLGICACHLHKNEESHKGENPSLPLDDPFLSFDDRQGASVEGKDTKNIEQIVERLQKKLYAQLRSEIDSLRREIDFQKDSESSLHQDKDRTKKENLFLKPFSLDESTYQGKEDGSILATRRKNDPLLNDVLNLFSDELLSFYALDKQKTEAILEIKKEIFHLYVHAEQLITRNNENILRILESVQTDSQTFPASFQKINKRLALIEDKLLSSMAFQEDLMKTMNQNFIDGMEKLEKSSAQNQSVTKMPPENNVEIGNESLALKESLETQMLSLLASLNKSEEYSSSSLEKKNDFF